MADAPDPLADAITAINTPEGQAFLGTLAGPESGGKFNVRFDGSPTGATFDTSTHPHIEQTIPQGWPMAGSTSDAAGAYQMLGSTWDGAAKRLGLPGAETGNAPFDPYYQKLGAWNVAQTAYGPSLLSDLQNGKVDQVMAKMRSSRQWDTANPATYQANLARISQTANAGISDQPQPAGNVKMADAIDPNEAWVQQFIAGAPSPAQTATPSAAAPPPSGIDQLANVGKPPIAPAVTGQGAPVTQAQLSGATPMPPAQALAPPAQGAPPNANDVLQNPVFDQLRQKNAANQTLVDSLLSAPTRSPDSVQRIIDLQKQITDNNAQLPEFQQGVALAKNMGEKQLGQAPSGQITPLAGATQSAQQMANATATGTQQAEQITQALAPREQKGAGSSIYFPPGSPVAQQYKDQNQLPDNVKLDALGGVTVSNTNPSSETIGKNFETLDKMGDQADAARQAQMQAQLLKTNLNAIGTSGPLTEHLGELGALARQAGVDPKTLAAMNIPDTPTIQQANALSLELLGATLRATFPGRITNSDIATMKPSNPNVNILNSASNYLLDNIILPKSQRDIDRYGYATTLPQNDTQTFKRQLFEWDQNNPYTKYMPAAPTASATPAPAAGTAPALPSGWSIKPLSPAAPAQGQQ